jgi:hypothetical protein
MCSSSDHHRPCKRHSHLRRRRRAAYDCVWTTTVTMDPWWSTNIISHWVQRCLTCCAELRCSQNWTFRMLVTSSELRMATSTKPCLAPDTRSWNTKSCHSCWQTHHLHWKPIWTTVYGHSLMSLLCATFTTYRYTRPRKEQEHQEKVWKVLKRLREIWLYAIAERCHLGVSGVGFLRFIINPNRIGLESYRLSKIVDWLTPESIWAVQGLLRFPNIYPPFIRKYANVSTPLSYLVKKAGTSRTPNQLKWERTRDAKLAREKIVDARLMLIFRMAPRACQFGFC